MLVEIKNKSGRYIIVYMILWFIVYLKAFFKTQRNIIIFCLTGLIITCRSNMYSIMRSIRVHKRMQIYFICNIRTNVR